MKISAAPFRDLITDKAGTITHVWAAWFRDLFAKMSTTLTEYRSDTEPDLNNDGDTGIWIDTNDSDRVYLVYRRAKTDQVKVELT